MIYRPSQIRRWIRYAYVVRRNEIDFKKEEKRRQKEIYKKFGFVRRYCPHARKTKLRFKSYWEAQRYKTVSREKITDSTFASQSIYYCEFCDGYHLTHYDLSGKTEWAELIQFIWDYLGGQIIETP